MTKKILLLLGLAIATHLPAASVTNPSNYTNLYGGVGVGSVGGSTYMVLTGVATVIRPLPLIGRGLTGDNGTTALADTAITTGAFVCQLTGMTNNAGVCFPTTVDTQVYSYTFDVPCNYRSGGALILGVHTNSTFTAGALSVTADVYVSAYNGTTSTTKLAGTAYQIPTSASAWNITITPTITGFAGSISPFTKVTLKLTKAVTSNAAQLQLSYLGFSYRPWGVMDGCY